MSTNKRVRYEELSVQADYTEEQIRDFVWYLVEAELAQVDKAQALLILSVLRGIVQPVQKVREEVIWFCWITGAVALSMNRYHHISSD